MGHKFDNQILDWELQGYVTRKSLSFWCSFLPLIPHAQIVIPGLTKLCETNSVKHHSNPWINGACLGMLDQAPVTTQAKAMVKVQNARKFQALRATATCPLLLLLFLPLLLLLILLVLLLVLLLLLLAAVPAASTTMTATGYSKYCYTASAPATATASSAFGY